MTVTDQSGRFSQRLPDGMSFNLNAESIVAGWVASSSITVTNGMNQMDALILTPSVEVSERCIFMIPQTNMILIYLNISH